jgi:translation initiation factor 3 subunit A
LFLCSIFTPDHEDMMVEFINLCTDLRDTRKTKDGLYFYRQLTQIQNPMSLEKICWHMVNSAEKRASEAKERAAAEAGGAAGGAGAVGSTLEDLEGEADQSPESLLMGAVTVEGTRERVEREILAPWLRHCWDIYRNVIDNVRWVPKLEHLYHAVVIKAMRFCRDYSRNAEFKKLIGMVRGHLAAQRRSQEANGFNMSQEQIERHLTTRFMQLEYCADLSLWVEAFKSVEDIHGIMSLNADVPPKASLMAAYYEKLGRIFWVSQNYLFHAYAWLKFYALSAAQNKSLTEEDKRNLASTVVLAALSIPISGANSSAGLYGGASALASAAAGAGVDVESSERDKKSKLAALLRQSTLPSRDALITEIINRGLLKVVRPEVAQLFRAMEVEFGPLTLIPKCSETLHKLRTETGPTVPSAHGSATAAASHSLSQYVPSLEKLALLRTLQQLSAVYSAISLESFKSLVTSGLSMPYSEIEAMIVRAVRSRIISVRIDHRDNCLKLGNESLEAGNVRRSLTELASRLQSIVEEQKLAAAIKPPTTPLSAIASNPADLEKQRSRLFELARFSSRNDPALAKRRQEEIEKRKQEEERLRQIEAKRVSLYVLFLFVSSTEDNASLQQRPAYSYAA